MARPEDALQLRVAKYLREALPAPGFWTSIIPERKQSVIAGARLKARGAKAGLSDIMIWYQGKFIAIELKAGTGRLSEHQKSFANAMDCNGFDAYEIRSVVDLHDVLCGCSIPILPSMRLSAQSADIMLSKPPAPKKPRAARQIKEDPERVKKFNRLRNMGIMF